MEAWPGVDSGLHFGVSAHLSAVVPAPGETTAMPESRPRIHAEDLSPRRLPTGGGRIWLPWLLAPAFALMPIGGCALAGKLRQTSPGQSAFLSAPAGDSGPPAASPPQPPVVTIGPE